MLHPRMKYSYCGIDSHKGSHTAVFLNCFHEKLGEITFPNEPSAFEKFIEDAEKIKMADTSLAFGLEDISAYGRHLTVFLRKNNFIVKHTNASLVAYERRSMNILHKTDSIDGECAARVLLNRFDSLPDAEPQDKYWMLKGLVIRRRNMVKINTNLLNHLHSYITAHYPNYSKYFSNLDCNASLAFYDKYPAPSLLKDVSKEELIAFLKETTPNYNWNKTAETIMNHFKNDGDTDTEYQDFRNLTVRQIISQIKSNLGEIQKITNILADFIRKFDYKLESMKGIDVITASNIIAEIGDITRFSTPAKMARYAGIAPVTYASGKTDVQYSNQRGNRILHGIFYRLAITMIMTVGKSKKKLLNPIFYNYYQKKISEGKTKRQSIKLVQRRLVNIIWSMMTKKTEYINPPLEVFTEEKEQEKDQEKDKMKRKKPSKNADKYNST